MTFVPEFMKWTVSLAFDSVRRINGIDIIVNAFEIELGDDIQEEEDEVILWELGGGGVGLVGITFGIPRAIGFASGGVHGSSRLRIGKIRGFEPPC